MPSMPCMAPECSASGCLCDERGTAAACLDSDMLPWLAMAAGQLHLVVCRMHGCPACTAALTATRHSVVTLHDLMVKRHNRLCLDLLTGSEAKTMD